MEKVTRCFMSVLLLSAVLSSGLDEEKFFGEGGTLELRPKFSGEINTVTWILYNNLVVEWLKSRNAVTYYGVFEGRTTLDKVTGILKITKMSSADSGVYSVEINNMPQPERYNVKLIKEVPQPVVELKPLTCSRTSENCNLVCERKPDEAVALTEAEPVTYSWKMGDGEWMDGEKIRDNINKETQRVETFSCRMKNPISEKQSDPIKNVFYNPNPADDSGGGSSAGPAVGGVFVVILALVAGVVGYVKREKIKKRFTKSGGDNKTDDVEQPFLLYRDDWNLDPLSKDGRNGDADAAYTEGADGEHGAASTQGADGEPDAAYTEGADGERGAAPTEGTDGEPDAAPTEGTDGEPDAAPTEGTDGEPDAAPTEGADGERCAAPTEGGDGEPDAAPTEGAGGEPDAAPTEGAGGPDAAPTQGADGLDAASKTGIDDTQL